MDIVRLIYLQPVKKAALFLIGFSILEAMPVKSLAADFTVLSGQTVTTQQVLGDDETGVVELGGTLSTTSSGVFADGDNVSFTNNGLSETTGNANKLIYTSGNNNTITNSGTMLASGGDNRLIDSSGASVLITNDGTAEVSGDSSRVFYSEGIDATIINTGTALTNDTNSVVIESNGDNASITNDGVLSALGDTSRVIESTGNNVTITNNGTISTNGYTTRGVYSYRGIGATIVNDGLISINGTVGRGIVSASDSSTIINNGIIDNNAIGGSNYGIHSFGSDSTVINNGTVSTVSSGISVYLDQQNTVMINNGLIESDHMAIVTDTSSLGSSIENNGTIQVNASEGASTAIMLDDDDDFGTITNNGLIVFTNDESVTGGDIINAGRADNVTIYNNGSIIGNGEDNIAIRSQGATASIINAGNISMNYLGGIAISSTGSNAIVENHGVITGKGGDNYGLDVGGDNSHVTNTGLIFLQGDNVNNSYGFSSNGENIQFHNTGSVIVSGDTGVGAYFTGDNALFNNNGLISVTGDGAYALQSIGDGFTLNVLGDSRIIGAIDLTRSSVSDTVNVYSGRYSTRNTFTGAESINLYGAGIITGETVTTVDTSMPTAYSSASADFSRAVHRTISERMYFEKPSKPVQLASLKLTPEMFAGHNKNSWVQVFGGQREHSAEVNLAGYEHAHYGINTGYEWDLDKKRVGVIAGFGRSEIESDTISYSTEVDSAFLGGYGFINVGNINFSSALIAGYSHYDHKRYVYDNINGLESAVGRFNGFFLSPSFELSSAYIVQQGLEFRPSANIAYHILWLDGYTELGTTDANLTLANTVNQSLLARLQLALAYKASNQSEVEIRVGAASRYTDHDDIQATLVSNPFKYSVAADDTATGYLGLSYRLAAQENLNVLVDIEGGAGGASSSLDAKLSVNWLF